MCEIIEPGTGAPEAELRVSVMWPFFDLALHIATHVPFHKIKYILQKKNSNQHHPPVFTSILQGAP
ncbi:MAG: hypothetical protein ABFR63_08655, partial [Thermodesulfobacteriota bacterium]